MYANVIPLCLPFFPHNMLFSAELRPVLMLSSLHEIVTVLCAIDITDLCQGHNIADGLSFMYALAFYEKKIIIIVLLILMEYFFLFTRLS